MHRLFLMLCASLYSERFPFSVLNDCTGAGTEATYKRGTRIYFSMLSPHLALLSFLACSVHQHDCSSGLSACSTRNDLLGNHFNTYRSGIMSRAYKKFTKVTIWQPGSF